MKTIYKSYDGKIFETKEECETYEKKLDDAISSRLNVIEAWKYFIKAKQEHEKEYKEIVKCDHVSTMILFDNLFGL